MSSVKENIRKIKVLAALIGGNILKNNWRSMNWRIIEYLRRNTRYQGVLLHHSLCSAATTIRIHYRPQSLSTAAIRIHLLTSFAAYQVGSLQIAHSLFSCFRWSCFLPRRWRKELTVTLAARRPQWPLTSATTNPITTATPTPRTLTRRPSRSKRTTTIRSQMSDTHSYTHIYTVCIYVYVYIYIYIYIYIHMHTWTHE